jgi:hypothetical protein
MVRIQLSVGTTMYAFWIAVNKELIKYLSSSRYPRKWIVNTLHDNNVLSFNINTVKSSDLPATRAGFIRFKRTGRVLNDFLQSLIQLKASLFACVINHV